MRPSSAASVHGGAGGTNCRPSVSSLEGLRNVLGSDAGRNAAPARRAAPGALAAPPAPDAPAAPAVPEDDRQMLQGLNSRLQGYLNNVKQLQENNDHLKKEIDDILAKRNVPEGRDWDKVEEPLEDLRQKIKDIALENARLLIDINNAKLANDDWKNKLDNEENTRKELENDLEKMKRECDESKQLCEQTKSEIDMVKNELDDLKEDHKNDVRVLREKIRDSEVKVVIDSPDSSLADVVAKIRVQYDKLAEKNQREMEEWYQSKFENMKVAEVKNTEALQSGKEELKDLSKQKQILEIKIQTAYGTIRNLEDTLRNVRLENSQRLAPLNQVILRLQADLTAVRSQVELQVEKNKVLVGVKMKLEEEINRYQELIHNITPEADSVNPENSAPKQQDEGKEEPLKK